MKKFYALLSACLLTCSIMAVTIEWADNPADQSTESNPLTYVVYQATNAVGPWYPIGSTTNKSLTLSLPPGRYFFCVTASNLWSESIPSNTLSTPAVPTKVGGVKASK